MQVKTLSKIALLLALALIIGTIENLMPPILPVLPYVKIGFSNIIIIIAILILNWKYSLLIFAIKSILIPIFLGNPIMILYSLPSSIIAVLISSILLKTKKISIPSTSTISAIIFNIVQLFVASLMTNNLVWGYSPYFVIIGSISGFGTGILTYLMIKYLPEKVLFF